MHSFYFILRECFPLCLPQFHLTLTPCSGGPTWVRTRDLPVMSRWLFQLSYGPFFYYILSSGGVNPVPKFPIVECGFRIIFRKPYSEIGTNRLLKNAHLPRFPHPSSLRRTTKYASLLRISRALHLGIFEQPGANDFFNNLIRNQSSKKLFSFFARLGCRNFLRAFASICRILSRVTSKSCPTSSRV